MGEVGGAVEGVDVPAVLRLHLLPGALFAEDAMVREGGAQALGDEGFTGAVGLRNDVDVAFELGRDALCVEAAKKAAGLARDLRGGYGEGKLGAVERTHMRTRIRARYVSSSVAAVCLFSGHRRSSPCGCAG